MAQIRKRCHLRLPQGYSSRPPGCPAWASCLGSPAKELGRRRQRDSPPPESTCHMILNDYETQQGFRATEGV
jgi:hypothetical protein